MKHVQITLYDDMVLIPSIRSKSQNVQEANAIDGEARVLIPSIRSKSQNKTIDRVLTAWHLK